MKFFACLLVAFLAIECITAAPCEDSLRQGVGYEFPSEEYQLPLEYLGGRIGGNEGFGEIFGNDGAFYRDSSLDEDDLGDLGQLTGHYRTIYDICSQNGLGFDGNFGTQIAQIINLLTNQRGDAFQVVQGIPLDNVFGLYNNAFGDLGEYMGPETVNIGTQVFGNLRGALNVIVGLLGHLPSTVSSLTTDISYSLREAFQKSVGIIQGSMSVLSDFFIYIQKIFMQTARQAVQQVQNVAIAVAKSVQLVITKLNVILKTVLANALQYVLLAIKTFRNLIQKAIISTVVIVKKAAEVFKTFVSTAVKAFITATSLAIKAISVVFQKIVLYIKGAIEYTVVIAKRVIQEFQEKFFEVVENTILTFNRLATGIKNLVTGAVAGAVVQLKNVATYIAGALSNTLQKLTGTVLNLVGSITTTIGRVPNIVIRPVAGIASGLIGTLTGDNFGALTGGSLLNGLSGENLLTGLTGGFGKIISGLTSQLTGRLGDGLENVLNLVSNGLGGGLGNVLGNVLGLVTGGLTGGERVNVQVSEGFPGLGDIGGFPGVGDIGGFPGVGDIGGFPGVGVIGGFPGVGDVLGGFNGGFGDLGGLTSGATGFGDVFGGFNGGFGDLGETIQISEGFPLISEGFSGGRLPCDKK